MAVPIVPTAAIVEQFRAGIRAAVGPMTARPRGSWPAFDAIARDLDAGYRERQRQWEVSRPQREAAEAAQRRANAVRLWEEGQLRPGTRVPVAASVWGAEPARSVVW